MATLPTEAGVSISFKARADWLEPDERNNPLELIPAVVQALSITLAGIAATASNHIARAQMITRFETDSDLAAEAIGLGTGFGEIVTTLDTDTIARLLANAETLPLVMDLDEGISVLRIEAGGREIFTITVLAIDLNEGSLIKSIRGVIRSHPFLSLLIAAGVPSGGTMVATEVHAAWKEHQAIEEVLVPSTCRTELKFDIDSDEIRSLTANQLDWANPPVGEDERSVICRLQYTLRLAGKFPGPIDGYRGKETMFALRAYMEERHLQHFEPNSARVLGQLALDASRAKITYRFTG